MAGAGDTADIGAEADTGVAATLVDVASSVRAAASQGAAMPGVAMPGVAMPEAAMPDAVTPAADSTAAEVPMVVADTAVADIGNVLRLKCETAGSQIAASRFSLSSHSIPAQQVSA